VTSDFEKDSEPWQFPDSSIDKGDKVPPFYESLNAMRANVSGVERLNKTQCI
jgi:hypothetical protein